VELTWLEVRDVWTSALHRIVEVALVDRPHELELLVGGARPLEPRGEDRRSLVLLFEPAGRALGQRLPHPRPLQLVLPLAERRRTPGRRLSAERAPPAHQIGSVSRVSCVLPF